MQFLNGRNDEALDLYFRFALGQALGVDGLGLLRICYRRRILSSPASARYADPTIWTPRRDEDLVLVSIGSGNGSEITQLMDNIQLPTFS